MAKQAKNNTYIGKLGEALVANLLQRKGHTIVMTNFKFTNCQIDIITVYKGYLIIWEVKLRLTESDEYPLKQVQANRLKFCTQCFLSKHPQYLKYKRLYLLYFLYVEGYKIKTFINYY